MARPLVYLAGPIAGLSYADATAWREEAYWALSDRGCNVLDPMRGKPELIDEACLNGPYDFSALVTARGIVTRDHSDIRRCDAVLMRLWGATRVSVGTMVELGWASAYRKPVVLLMEPGNPHDHPFVRELTGFRALSLDEAIEYVASVLGK